MKCILMVIAPVNFRDEEYFVPYTIFIENGYSVTTASEKLGDIIGSKGAIANASLLLKDVSASDFDCVVFVGGQGSYAYDNNQHIQRIAQDFYSHRKLTTAICHAPILLAKAGILHDKSATVFQDDATELQTFGVHYNPSEVVVDSTIITANGPLAAEHFAKTIINNLDNALK